MQNLNAKELKVIEATKGTTVHMATNTEFGNLLAKCSMIVGASQEIKAQQVVVIKQVVTEQFPWCTMSEIERACSLNVGRDLCAESEKVAKSENQPVDHITIFGELTCDSICAMLKRYQVVRNAAKIKFQALENMGRPQLTSGTVQIITDEMWLDVFKTDVERYKAGKSYWDCIAGRMVQWLEETGRLTVDTFTESEWAQINDLAERNVLNEKQISRTQFNRMEDYQKKAFGTLGNVEKRNVLYEFYIKKVIANELVCA